MAALIAKAGATGLQVGGKQAGKQAAKQATKQAGKQATKQVGKQATKQAGKQATKQAGKQATKQAGKQASKQAGKQVGKEASKQAGKEASKQAGKQAGKQASKQTTKQGSKEAVKQAQKKGTKQAGKQVKQEGQKAVKKEGQKAVKQTTTEQTKKASKDTLKKGQKATKEAGQKGKDKLGKSEKLFDKMEKFSELTEMVTDTNSQEIPSADEPSDIPAPVISEEDEEIKSSSFTESPSDEISSENNEHFVSDIKTVKHEGDDEKERSDFSDFGQVDDERVLEDDKNVVLENKKADRERVVEQKISVFSDQTKPDHEIFVEREKSVFPDHRKVDHEIISKNDKNLVHERETTDHEIVVKKEKIFTPRYTNINDERQFDNRKIDERTILKSQNYRNDLNGYEKLKDQFKNKNSENGGLHFTLRSPEEIGRKHDYASDISITDESDVYHSSIRTDPDRKIKEKSWKHKKIKSRDDNLKSKHKNKPKAKHFDSSASADSIRSSGYKKFLQRIYNCLIMESKRKSNKLARKLINLIKDKKPRHFNRDTHLSQYLNVPQPTAFDFILDSGMNNIDQFLLQPRFGTCPTHIPPCCCIPESGSFFCCPNQSSRFNQY